MASLSSSIEEKMESVSAQDSHQLSTPCRIQALRHTSQCCTSNCPQPACQEMKREVQHVKRCKRRSHGGCPVCKRLISFCCYQAMQCPDNKCPEPFCLNIKQKLAQQHQPQQAQMVGRSMATADTLSVPQQLCPAMPTPQPAPLLSLGGMISPGFPTGNGTQPPNMASPGKSTGLLPVVAAAQPPPAIIAAACQIEPEEQQLDRVNIKDKISVRPCMANPLPQTSVNVPCPGPNAPIVQDLYPGLWPTAPMPKLRLTQQNIQHPVIEMTVSQQAVAEPQLQGVPQQQACNPSTNALQDLQHTMKSPSSQQQQNVLSVLQSNPQLMDDFIQQRTAKHEGNQSDMQLQQAPQQPPQQPGMHPQSVSPTPAIAGIPTQNPSTSQTLQAATQPFPGGMASVSSSNESESWHMSLKESRRLRLQHLLQSLVHICQCYSSNCLQPACQKMKRVVEHMNECKRKTSGGCPVCRDFYALCCYHAKRCQDDMCQILFCVSIKQKIRQQQILQQQMREQQRIRQQEMRQQIRHQLQQVQQARLRVANRNRRMQNRTRG